MSFTGPRAWKEVGIGPEERIDRFFNLIDHAVDGGIPLSALYSRQHVKEFLLYTLQHCNDSRKKDHAMSKLTLTSTFASTITIGDPGVLAFNLTPKETKSVEVDEAQLRQLTPGLEKLKAAKWINYTVTDGSSLPAPVVTAPVETPAPPSAPAVPLTAPVEEVPEETPVEDPVVPPVEVPPVTPPAEVPPVPEVPVVQDAPPSTDPAPAPGLPKSPLIDRKNRNR